MWIALLVLGAVALFSTVRDIRSVSIAELRRRRVTRARRAMFEAGLAHVVEEITLDEMVGDTSTWPDGDLDRIAALPPQTSPAR